MDYKTNKPIYLQIADYVCENILHGVWKTDERIPSARDLSISLAVNPNTVTRAFSYLEDKRILTQKRGIGYFVETNGLQQVKNNLKEEFLNEDLPNLFKKMQKLNISIKMVIDKHTECCC